MEKTKMEDQYGTLENCHELKIASLSITYEDNWLADYVINKGGGVDKSPNYLALKGDFKPLKEWFEYRGLNWEDRLKDLLGVLHYIVTEGQTKPVLVYKDGRINNGHKRTAVMLFLGYETVKVKFVPDDYKL